MFTTNAMPARTREEVVRRANVIMKRTGAPEALGILARLHFLPLTKQGVRNLDILAPTHLRNGNRFRKPKHYEAICPHPEDAMGANVIEEVIEGEDEHGPFSYTLYFRACEDCGAEIGA